MSTRLLTVVIVLLLAAVAVGGFYTGKTNFGRGAAASVSVTDPSAKPDPHAGHDHGPEGDDHAAESNLLPLSEQARRHLGLRTGSIELSEFWRTITMPGVVEEKPGHSERRISTSVNGIVVRVHVSPGQTVHPGDPLVEIQPTGEVLANAQASLLKTLQDLDLVDVELKRIEPLAQQGSIPGTRVLEKQYERQRLESLRQVQVQELLVRGLSQNQVTNIIQSKVLLRSFTVRVPSLDGDIAGQGTNREAPVIRQVAQTETVAETEAFTYSVERIDVFPGKLIESGEELCDLAIHTSLQIAGLGFQKESELIGQVLDEERPVTALFDTTAGEPLVRDRLMIQYADNVVDAETRAFRFYLPLQNEVLRDRQGPGGVTFRSWRFKPGQRVQLQVPVEHWTGKIVLPTTAVVKEGAEAYVFRAKRKEFERVTVAILYEDVRFTVLVNDGSLKPGQVIALNEAYQLNLALKKAQGSGVDLHAGHNH